MAARPGLSTTGCRCRLEHSERRVGRFRPSTHATQGAPRSGHKPSSRPCALAQGHRGHVQRQHTRGSPSLLKPACLAAVAGLQHRPRPDPACRCCAPGTHPSYTSHNGHATILALHAAGPGLAGAVGADFWQPAAGSPLWHRQMSRRRCPAWLKSWPHHAARH